MKTKDWRKICADCQEGEPPEKLRVLRRAYGCNSPTYGKHPTCKESLQVGNAAKMREAVVQINRIVWDKRRHTKEETEAHRLATEVLSTPPRNCDKYSHDEALRIWSSLPESKENGCFDEWLFAEVKGE